MKVSCGNVRVLHVLHQHGKLSLRHGLPDHIQSDNGSEYVAQAVHEWLGRLGVKTLYTEPGPPWEKWYCESFNSMLRDECCQREDFCTQREAQTPIEHRRNFYNTERPHSALGYRPPAPRTTSLSPSPDLRVCALPRAHKSKAHVHAGSKPSNWTTQVTRVRSHFWRI